jgi:hypothetical protein
MSLWLSMRPSTKLRAWLDGCTNFMKAIWPQLPTLGSLGRIVPPLSNAWRSSHASTFDSIRCLAPAMDVPRNY